LPHREVRIVVPGTNQLVPIGRVGELCTRSPELIMDGYWKMKEESAATIDAEGWLHTGDLCSMDDRGYVRFEGRSREVIIRGGENIYPREVEDVYVTHPAIADIAVVGAPDERWGETVAAFVRFAPGPCATEDELRAFGRERLASFKVPVTWRFVGEFPLTPSGKIKKYELRRTLEPTR
jgi:fatty-acyl-CoA synthase